MTTERRDCPSCGRPTYVTDDICMSCGADLRAASPPEEQPSPEPDAGTSTEASSGPGTPRPPTPRPRPQMVKPWYQAPVETCGRLWDIYPWIGIGIYVVGGVSFAPGVPDVLGVVVLIIYALWHSLFLFWVIVDVLYFGVDWWWGAIAFLCCYPIGLLVYLWKTR